MTFDEFKSEKIIKPLIIKAIQNKCFLESQVNNAMFYRDIITGAEMFYKVVDNKLKIHVRQTDDIQDLITNIKCNFDSAGRKLQGKIITEMCLGKFTNEFNSVFISGYSQGGAIAPYVAKYLSYLNRVAGFGNIKFECVGFEAPRYTKKKFTEDVKILNIENGNDLVNKIPFWLKKSGDIVKIGNKRKWYKTGIKFRYDKTQSGMYKFFTIPDHEWKNVENVLLKYCNM